MTDAIKERFRGFLPIVVDLETGGFNADEHAVLEIAAVTLKLDDDTLSIAEQFRWDVEPAPGTRVEEASLAVTGIDLGDPERSAINEDTAVRELFRMTRSALKQHDCQRAILTAHNAHFDLGFILTAAERNGIKRNPFHPFTVIDTASLAAVAFGHTVLSEACARAGIEFDGDRAHNAGYDALIAARLFCEVVNRWQRFAPPL